MKSGRARNLGGVIEQALLVAIVASVAFLGGMRSTEAQAPSGMTHQEIIESLSDEDADRALDLLGRAREAEAGQDWLEAYALYTDLVTVAPSPRFRFKQADCLEKLGRYTEALEIYRDLLESPEADVVEESAARIAAFEALTQAIVTTIRVQSVPPGAEISVDGVVVGLAVDGGVDLEVEPGAHHVVAALEGYTAAEEDVEAVSGEETVVEIRLTPVADVVEPGGRSLVVPLALGGAAVAVAGVGLVLDLAISNDREDSWNSDSDCRNGVAAEKTYCDDLWDEAQLFHTLGLVSYGVAGALAVGAVVAFLLGGDEGGEETGVSFSPWTGRRVVGGSIGFRF